MVATNQPARASQKMLPSLKMEIKMMIAMITLCASRIMLWGKFLANFQIHALLYFTFLTMP